MTDVVCLLKKTQDSLYLYTKNLHRVHTGDIHNAPDTGLRFFPQLVLWFSIVWASVWRDEEVSLPLRDSILFF